VLKKRLVLYTVLSATCVFGAEPAGQSAYRWHHEPGRAVSLRAGEKTLWSYHFAAGEGFPYFHPVATPDGTCLTALAPADHPWHRAVWFSWKYLNGVNYWDWGGKRVAVPDGRTRRTGEEIVELGPKRASVTFDLQYASADEVVLTERRRVTVEQPRADGSYALDWHLTFTAPDKDVLLERTPPDEKPWGGYGGLSYRATGAMRQFRVIDSEGRRGAEAHGKPARCMDFSGLVGPAGTPAGVAMFDHPDNPRHPSPWYVSVKGMGYFNPAFLFAEPYTLPAGKSLTLRYRLLVHPGAGDAARLRKKYESFVVTAFMRSR